MRFGLGDADDSDSGSSSSSSVRLPASRRSASLLKKAATPSTPFSPTPVHIQPTPRAKRGRLVPLGSSDEDDSGDDEPASDDDDSEEDEWPVGPIGSIGLRGWRRPAGRGKGKAHNQSFAEDQRVFGGPDPLDLWDDKQKASSWATANRSFHLSLSRAMSSSPAPARPAAHDRDVHSIQSLLASLALAQSESQSALVASFDARNSALWDSIESSIRAAEQEEGEKRRVLEDQRRKGEEAEKKAREMREAEERKKAKELEDEQRKQHEDEQKKVASAKKDAEDQAQREQEARVASEQAAATAAAEGESPQADWQRWTAKMTEIKKNVLPVVSQNPAYRKACFTAKRAITPKIGQLTSSASNIAQIIQSLHDTLSSMRPPAGQEGSSQPYTWTLNHLAKALVKQCEAEVTAKIGTAYPLGRVVVGLLARGHAELGDVLMARLVKKCFWVTGWWPGKLANQTIEQYEKTLGRAKRTANESSSQYASRMAGYMALYASIIQTSPHERPQGPCPPEALALIPPHFRPSAGWRWLVLSLRTPIISHEAAPALLVAFLEIAGEALLAIYGRQMSKFLEVLLREGVRSGKAGFSDKAKSSTVRLQLWLEEWEKTGRVEETAGKTLDR